MQPLVSGAYLTIVELKLQFADEARDFSRALNPCLNSVLILYLI